MENIRSDNNDALSEGASWFTKWRHLSPRLIVMGVVGVLFIAGVLLRIWGMPDGMLWSIDQSRDYRIAVGVLEEGWGYLPLLGPGAGGTDFHLGPLHTYIQIMGLSLTGVDHPIGLLIIEFLLSIATIGLFFILSRKFFSQTVSLILTAHVAVGLLFVSLARFTWNPNTIPFFVTLLLLVAGTLATPQERFRKFTVAILALAVGVLMQLHTIAFVIVPIVLVLWQWRLRLLRTIGEWTIALVILLVLFLPVFLSEYITHFGLLKAFFASSAERIDSWLSLGKAGFKMLYDIVWYHMMVLTGQNTLPEMVRLESSKSLGTLFDRNEKLAAIVAVGMVAIVSLWYAFVHFVRHSVSEVVRTYGTLVFILVAVSLIVIAPLSLSSDPRYFHIIYFVPLLAYGWLLHWLLVRPKGKLVAMLIATSLLGGALFAGIRWVDTTTNYAYRYDPSFRLTVMEEYYQANLEQYEQMSDYITQILRERGKEIVYVHVSPYEERALMLALLYQHNITMLPFVTDYSDEKGLYVMVRHAKFLEKEEVIPERISRKFSVRAQENFGTFSVLILDPRVEASLPAMLPEKRGELIDLNAYRMIPCSPGVVERCRLRDLFD